jgi:hypothetical protein
MSHARKCSVPTEISITIRTQPRYGIGFGSAADVGPTETMDVRRRANHRCKPRLCIGPNFYHGPKSTAATPAFPAGFPSDATTLSVGSATVSAAFPLSAVGASSEPPLVAAAARAAASAGASHTPASKAADPPSAPPSAASASETPRWSRTASTDGVSPTEIVHASPVWC